MERTARVGGKWGGTPNEGIKAPARAENVNPCSGDSAKTASHCSDSTANGLISCVRLPAIMESTGKRLATTKRLPTMQRWRGETHRRVEPPEPIKTPVPIVTAPPDSSPCSMINYRPGCNARAIGGKETRARVRMCSPPILRVWIAWSRENRPMETASPKAISGESAACSGLSAGINTASCAAEAFLVVPINSLRKIDEGTVPGLRKTVSIRFQTAPGLSAASIPRLSKFGFPARILLGGGCAGDRNAPSQTFPEAAFQL